MSASCSPAPSPPCIAPSLMYKQPQLQLGMTLGAQLGQCAMWREEGPACPGEGVDVESLSRSQPQDQPVLPISACLHLSFQIPIGLAQVRRGSVTRGSNESKGTWEEPGEGHCRNHCELKPPPPQFVSIAESHLLPTGCVQTLGISGPSRGRQCLCFQASLSWPTSVSLSR